MTIQHRLAPNVRSANVQDIPFLARMEIEASIPPFGVSMWERVLVGTGADPLTFAAAMYGESASLWGNVEDFIVLDLDGDPAACCAVFRPPVPGPNQGSFDLRRLPAVAARLGWDAETARTFETGYRKAWGDKTGFLEPQAEVIVETVAVAPAHRGKGLGNALMHAAFARGVALGAQSIGLMVIHGNEQARRLYDKHFDPYATFHTAYFNHEFLGVTKYWASLTQPVA